MKKYSFINYLVVGLVILLNLILFSKLIMYVMWNGGYNDVGVDVGQNIHFLKQSLYKIAYLLLFISSSICTILGLIKMFIELLNKKISTIIILSSITIIALVILGFGCYATLNVIGSVQNNLNYLNWLK